MMPMGCVKESKFLEVVLALLLLLGRCWAVLLLVQHGMFQVMDPKQWVERSAAVVLRHHDLHPDPPMKLELEGRQRMVPTMEIGQWYRNPPPVVVLVAVLEEASAVLAVPD